MSLHDEQCPICGKVNHKLDFAETNGWMECVFCNHDVQIPKYAQFKRIPLYAPEQLAAKFGAAR